MTCVCDGCRPPVRRAPSACPATPALLLALAAALLLLAYLAARLQ